MINLQLFALSDDKLNAFSFNHASQVDELGKATGDFQTVQQYFDSRAEELRVKYNSLIDQLESVAGAGGIGAVNTETSAASNIQAQIDKLYQDILNVVSSGITPGTPGYYLRTNDSGTSVEWSKVDTTQWVQPVSNNRIAIDELLAYNSVTSSVDVSDSIFYDFPDSTKQLTAGTIDRAKCYIATVNTGTNSVDVDAILSGKDGEAETDLTQVFLVGEEVTLQNATVKERLTVSNVTATTVTFDTNISGTFPAGANLYRSNLNVLNGVYKFGGFSEETTIDRTTPVQVVNAAYDTSGNGGRKLVRLDDGTLVSVLANGTTDLRYYKSIDDGLTWSRLCYVNTGSATLSSIATDGTLIYGVVAFPGVATSYSITINPATQADVEVTSLLVTLDTSQTAYDSVSIAIASNGDLHACWASKNATYPNSFNIRYSKSVDGGATWATVTQITSRNTTGTYVKDPSIIINQLGNPVILCSAYTNTDYLITSWVYDGTTWLNGGSAYGATVYDGGVYSQLYPSADVLSDGTIVVAWTGKDAVETLNDNVRFSQSTDNGVTWSAMEKLTSGAQNKIDPSITRDKNDNIYISYSNLSTDEVLFIKGTTGSWDTPIQVVDMIGAGTIYVSSCNNYRDFTKPLIIYNAVDTLDIRFYGEWIEGTETDITDIDIRLNVESWENVDSIAAWLYSNNVAGVTVDAALSVRASGADESYTDLADTEVEVDASNNYYVASGAVGVPEKLSTLRYNVTRSLTTDDVDIKRIQGAVA